MSRFNNSHGAVYTGSQPDQDWSGEKIATETFLRLQSQQFVIRKLKCKIGPKRKLEKEVKAVVIPQYILCRRRSFRLFRRYLYCTLAVIYATLH